MSLGLGYVTCFNFAFDTLALALESVWYGNGII